MARDGEANGGTGLADIDEALLRLRRLWSHRPRPGTSAGASAELGRPVELSSVLVVDAVARASVAGEEATVRRVAETLDVERSTASRLVEVAVRGGWVERTDSPDDARRSVLVLTGDGRELDRRSRMFRQGYLASVLRSWAPDDVATFARLLGEFAAGVAARSPEQHAVESERHRRD
jgi:DNA-binding MarR family transcriptional regulator